MKKKERKEKKDGYIENENEEGRMKEKDRTAVLLSAVHLSIRNQNQKIKERKKLPLLFLKQFFF